MERKIGEVFQDGEVTLKVELETSEGSCKRCYYDPFMQCPNSLEESTCVGLEREDNTDVIFTQINQ